MPSSRSSPEKMTRRNFQVAGGNAWKLMGMQAAVNPACVAMVDPTGTNSSEHWKCLLAENAAQHIESRIFPLEHLWGVFGSFCLVNSVFTNSTPFETGLHCDMGGRAKHSMHACVEYGWECSDVEFSLLSCCPIRSTC